MEGSMSTNPLRGGVLADKIIAAALRNIDAHLARLETKAAIAAAAQAMPMPDRRIAARSAP
jgi:hypothetical protein